MSGGLFSEYEEASGLRAATTHEQSQSKEARYARAYRRDPENNRRINLQKKRRRALSKEREMGNVSSMFESAARPGKSEQQTIENAHDRSDHKKLPNPSDEGNRVSTQAGNLNELGRLIGGSDQEPHRTTREEPTSTEIMNQALIEVLSEMKNELRSLKEEVSKPTAPILPKVNKPEQQASVSGIAIANSAKVSETAIDEKRDFLAGIFGKLSQLDGGAFITNFPAALALGYFAYLAFGFVVEQTLPLYRSLKFPDPELACYGAIVIAIGFSALSVVSKSSVAKLFTAVIIAYEVLIVWAGSQANQRDLASEALRANPIHFSTSEAYGIAKVDYGQKKARYEDKNSDVYHNGWFKINHLDPAQKSLDEASAKLAAVESELGKKYETDWMHLVLKALYRLSAVALVMLLAKETIKTGVGALRLSEA